MTLGRAKTGFSQVLLLGIVVACVLGGVRVGFAQSLADLERKLVALEDEYKEALTEMKQLAAALPQETRPGASLTKRKEYADKILALRDRLKKFKGEMRILQKRIAEAESYQPPVLRLVEIKGPKSGQGTASNLWGEAKEKKEVQFSEGSAGYVYRRVYPRASKRSSEIYSLKIVQAPSEIVPGQPFTIGAELKHRKGYKENHRGQLPKVKQNCSDSKDCGPRITLLARSHTRRSFDNVLMGAKARSTDDVNSYCSQVVPIGPEDSGCLKGALEKDGKVGITVTFFPEKEKESADRVEYFYRARVNAAGIAENKQLPAKRFFHVSRKGTSKHEIVFEIDAPFAPHLMLVYRTPEQGKRAIAPLPPFSHAPEFNRPPKAEEKKIASAQGEGAKKPGAESGSEGTSSGSGESGRGSGGAGIGGAGSATGPGGRITVASIRPRQPKIAGFIREWIGSAEPPQNMTEGANLRYTKRGAMVGTTLTGPVKSPHETGRFDSAFLWQNNRKLDSVNHCTLEEYVLSKAQGKGTAHCRGRYKRPPPRPIPKIAGTKAKRAKGRLLTAKLKAKFIGGDEPPSKEKEFTVQSTIPPIGTRMKVGSEVKVRLYSKYNPSRPVPDVGKLSVKAARKRLADAGFKVKVVGGDPAPTKRKEFTIQEVRPKPGTRHNRSRPVELVVHSKYQPPDPTKNRKGEERARRQKQCDDLIEQGKSARGDRARLRLYRQAQQMGCSNRGLTSAIAKLQESIRQNDKRTQQKSQCAAILRDAETARDDYRKLRFYQEARQKGCGGGRNLDSAIAALERSIKRREQEARKKRQCDAILRDGNAARDDHQKLGLYQQARRMGCGGGNLDNAISSLQRAIQQKERAQQKIQKCNLMMSQARSAQNKQQKLRTYQQAQSMGCQIQGLGREIARIQQSIQKDRQCSDFIRKGKATRSEERKLQYFQQAQRTGCQVPGLNNAIVNIQRSIQQKRKCNDLIGRGRAARNDQQRLGYYTQAQRMGCKVQGLSQEIARIQRSIQKNQQCRSLFDRGNKGRTPEEKLRHYEQAKRLGCPYQLDRAINNLKVKIRRKQRKPPPTRRPPSGGGGGGEVLICECYDPKIGKYSGFLGFCNPANAVNVKECNAKR
jgi:exonuclease VII small subunit